MRVETTCPKGFALRRTEANSWERENLEMKYRWKV